MARWLWVRLLILVRLRAWCVAWLGPSGLGMTGVCLRVGARLVMT
jgi:hypothetical protein